MATDGLIETAIHLKVIEWLPAWLGVCLEAVRLVVEDARTPPFSHAQFLCSSDAGIFTSPELEYRGVFQRTAETLPEFSQRAD
jgi:hypothetical protein